jgi:2-polyprenyl-6-methoxyphenol hydroxylase-like FAD-dependent oxidoreductase
MNDDPHRSASHANVAGGSGIGSGARFSVERSQIQRHLDILQKNLDSNQQVRDEEVSKFDDNAMPDLIALANRKRPSLNAHLVIGVDGFVEKTLNLLTTTTVRARPSLRSNRCLLPQLAQTLSRRCVPSRLEQNYLTLNF